MEELRALEEVDRRRPPASAMLVVLSMLSDVWLAHVVGSSY